MQQNEPQFDEPALKAAIRRVSAEEIAPAGLRDQVARQIGNEGGGKLAGTKVAGGWLTAQRVKMAVAASVALLAMGVAAYQVRELFFPPRVVQPYSYHQDLPTEFAEAMVRAHDSNAGMTTPTSAVSELTQVKEKLSRDIGIPVVMSADLGDGWMMNRSGETVVGKAKAAYVTYASKGQTVTVFSIPADAVYQAPEGAQYAQTVNGHGLSGFREGSGLYCVVASATAGAPTRDQLNALREKLHAYLPARSCGGTGGESLVQGSARRSHVDF